MFFTPFFLFDDDVSGSFPNGTLTGVLPTPLFQLDANLLASYPGSGQTLANVIAAPADASAQTAYDFWLGDTSAVTTDDPTFVPGVYPTSSKFTVDGGDRCRIKAMTSLLNTIHRSDTGVPFWFSMAYMTPNVTTTQLLFGDSNGSTAAGFRVEINGSNIRFVRADGTVNATTIPFGGLVANTPYLFFVNYDPITGNYSMALNSRTLGTTGTNAFSNLTDATGNIAFGGASGGSARPVAGSELYGCSMGLGTLSNANVSAAVDYYNALHGRTYA